ncbi:cytochrome ubiquinol oxidase subunit I [Chlamydiifrater phoenicopteri]|uniref:cytochrome ubiquinol oxidase subunit I n=1 Tax=Chlamydiifrater phoenicopteri TaxID=2681469 RepID=UPI001BCF07AB|nr:cytochrome ubiquinol oxidase subunit I [Chlamydiifrater phoenicopteri]
MDALLLSRIQFGLFVGFHYLFVPLSLGLGGMLVIMQGLFLKTGLEVYRRLTYFWVKIFSLLFVVGVVTGLMQIFSFGSNWARFSTYVGNVFGTLLGSEGVFAFFLESGFLGVLVFGRGKVSEKMYFFSTCMVALGAHMSAFWIIAANSWMQTPSGYKMAIVNGQEVPVIESFWKAVFSPSFLDRFTHATLGAWLSGCFLVLSISAYYLWKKRHLEFAVKGLKVSSITAVILLVLQLWSGDTTARHLAVNQPAKLAAFEGVFKTKERTPIWLFGYVDVENEKVHGVAIPGALSLLVHRNINTPVTGLDAFSKEDIPNVQVVFQLYHLMIALWGVMFLLAITGIAAYKGKRWAQSNFFFRLLSFSVLIPAICNEVGWAAAEIGRQPWIVQGLMRVKDATSLFVNRGQVIQSLVLFSIIFCLLFGLFTTLLLKKISEGPEQE